MSYTKLPLILLLTLALGLTACAESDASTPIRDTAPATDVSSTPASGDVQTVVIEPIGNEMKFKQTAFTVAPGQQVKLVFKNTATSPAMQHNVVFVRGEDAINRVGQAAMSAADSEYIPEDGAIFAYTPLAQPGSTVEVTFTAPEEPGDYPYICTFPGHYMMMQGTMTVK